MSAGSTFEAIRSGGQDLWVRRLGRGPRVVMLHGGPGLDHQLLLPLAEALSDRHEVWLPDLPGHGRHRSEAEGPPGLTAMFDRVSRWIGHLDPQPFAVAGHSLGAWLARESLRRGRIAPDATVWISPPAGGVDSGVREPDRAQSPGTADDARAELIAFVIAETGRPPAPAFLRAANACDARHPREFPALLRQLHRTLLRDTPRCDPGIPTLVITGAEDRITPPHHAAAVAAATDGSRLVVLDRGGHFPDADGDPSLARSVGSFLAEAIAGR